MWIKLIRGKTPADQLDPCNTGGPNTDQGDPWVFHGSTWSASVTRINLIREFSTNQLDPQVLHGSTWSASFPRINLIRVWWPSFLKKVLLYWKLILNEICNISLTFLIYLLPFIICRWILNEYGINFGSRNLNIIDKITLILLIKIT